MGRLVTPISKEEFEKLPKWQQWVGHNALWLVPLAVLLAAIIGALLACI